MKLQSIIEKVGIDRVLHLLSGFSIASLGWPWGIRASLLTWAASCAAGLAKEIYDEISYGGFDVTDLLWTIGGGTAAMLYGLISIGI